MHDAIADDGLSMCSMRTRRAQLPRALRMPVLSFRLLHLEEKHWFSVVPYQWQHEPCLYGWKKGGKHQWYSDRKQTTIWEYDRPKASKYHPTMKPVALMSYPIKNSTMTNGIILDPFLGSGSTMIACEETNRVCVGIELDPKFMDVIVARFRTAYPDKANDVYVIRDGQKLTFDEVTAEMDGAENEE